jgi:RNA-directed DNA polymerase
MKRQRLVAQSLADALLAGSCDAAGFVERAAHVLGRRHRWIAPLCSRVFQTFGSSLEQRDRARLVDWIGNDRGYRDAWLATRPPRVVHHVLDPPRMSPRRGTLASCGLPDLATTGDLAAWLGLRVEELDWFADLRGSNPPVGPLCHYRYAWVPKSYGVRLIEAPKPRLREVQRRILRGILDPVPAHGAAHGFRPGRSCRSYAEPHVGREVVLRMDLRDFFSGIPARRIHAIFETLGYPQAVARTLTALCTNRVPIAVARRGGATWIQTKRLGAPHLPQGAPTSPALANLCAFHLDLRLDALARSGEWQYTRYADDLALSGRDSLRRRIAGISTLVAAIAMEEGFEVNHRKTRIMHSSHRQLLAGVVVNERPNVRRQDFDRLKAVLNNCVRLGPASQQRDARLDFRAHLSGQIAHVRSLNPERGEKLQAIFHRIEWAG